MNALKRLLGSERGQNAIEGLFAIAILAVVAQSAFLVIRNMSRYNVQDADRVFASEKAIEMLEEMRAMTLDQSVKVDILDQLNDQTVTAATNQIPLYRFTLTTRPGVYLPNGNTPDAVAARHSTSGNPLGTKGFRFVRNVLVDRTTNVRNPETERFVRVRIFDASPNSGPSAAAGSATAKHPTRAPVAEVSGLISTSGDLNRPTQAMDIYMIALENVPGWWSRTSTLIPLMQSSLLTLQARNPGLRFRSHWIKRISYGRDLEYTPEANDAVTATVSGSLKRTYVYPGSLTLDSGEAAYLLDPSYYGARIWKGLAGGGYSLLNQAQGYAPADQFNHAMRYPDELRLYDAYSAIAANNGQDPPEISLRMLMENLYTGSEDWRNTLLINLHGEMTALPPLRNVSDAAKDPDYFYNNGRTTDAWGSTVFARRQFRAVSHPERLYYNTTVTALSDTAIRVYAYDLSPTTIVNATSLTVTSAWAGVSTENDLIDQITLFVPNASTANLSTVARVQGNSYTPYFKHLYSPSSNNTMSNWPAGGDDASWAADNFTTPDGRAGLRIRLFGVTPTARAYAGPIYAP